MNNVLTRKFNPELLIEDFIEDCQKFVELYSCPLCEGILIEAIIDRCGHSFCRKCIEILKLETNKCPFSKIEIKDFLTNLVVNSVIEKQICYCKNKHLNCEWKGKLSERKDHLYYDCTKEDVHCEYENCNVKILRENLNEHMLNCDFRKISCHHCKETISFNELDKHYKNCPNLPVLCPNDCGMEVPNCEITKHLEMICDNSIASCPFKLVGCDFIEMRKSLKIHLEDFLEMHLKLINKNIVHLQDQINSQNKEIVSIKEKNADLTNNLNTTKSDFQKSNMELSILINTLSKNLDNFKLYNPVPLSNFIPNFFEVNSAKIFSISKEKNSIKKILGDNEWYGILSLPIQINSERQIINFKIISTQNSCIMFGISFSNLENPIKKGSYQQLDDENFSYMFYCYNSSIYSKGRSNKYGSGVCVDGDVITLTIYFLNSTIAFRKNGIHFSDPFKVSCLEKADYRKKLRFGVDMCEYGDEIMFI